MTEAKPLIVAGADGFGEDLKNVLVEHCRAQGYEVDDLGTGAYYDKAGEVARRVQTDGAKGLLFCGTGMGVGIVANRFSGIQAATCENVAAARCARAINDSNVLCLGGKVTTPADARAICDAWLCVEIKLRASTLSTRRASVAASPRWRGDSTPSTRRGPRDRAGSMTWRLTKG